MDIRDEEVSVKTPEFVSIQYQPAGLGSRAISFMIDQFVLNAINFIIFFVFIFMMTEFEEFFFQFDSPLLPIAIVVILIFAINTGYFFFLEYFTGGRTVGKKVMGIRVIQENGHSITLLSSFIRNFMRMVDSLPAGYLIGIIMIFTHSKHKRLGDVVAGTLVVHERGKKKHSKSMNALDVEMVKRNITKDNIELSEWELKSFGAKDWKLLKTYCERFVQVSFEERREITMQISDILLKKAGIVTEGKSINELENLLLALYLKLKDEWEYDL